MKFLADENFNHNILNGLYNHLPNCDVITANVAKLLRAGDPTVLGAAAFENRVLLSHDISTMSTHFDELYASGEPVPGVMIVPTSLSIKAAIDEIILVASCTLEGELQGQFWYLPL